MKTFRQFISENKDDAFQKAKLIAKYLSGHRKESFLTAMDAFSAGLADKSIYNAAFTDHYSYGFSRGLDSAYEGLRKEHRDKIKEILSSDDDSEVWSVNPTGINKAVKIYAKYPQVPQDIKDFMEAIKDLPAAIKELKTFIVKGRVPKPVDPSRFVKPMAPLESQKLAMKFLQEAVDSFKKEYEASVRKYTMQIYEKIKPLTDPKDFKALTDREKSIAAYIFMRDGYKLDAAFKLKENHAQIIEKLIQDTVRDVIEHFVAKNTSKLALIFAKRPSVSEHKILHTRIQAGMLENDMYFAFPDGSSFTITSQVVFKYSAGGKNFVQYPTRFTNVTMPDGTKMSSPTEEKMIKEF